MSLLRGGGDEIENLVFAKDIPQSCHNASQRLVCPIAVSQGRDNNQMAFLWLTPHDIEKKGNGIVVLVIQVVEVKILDAKRLEVFVPREIVVDEIAP